jgi:hypothetical protein
VRRDRMRAERARAVQEAGRGRGGHRAPPGGRRQRTGASGRADSATSATASCVRGREEAGDGVGRAACARRPKRRRRTVKAGKPFSFYK